MSVIDERKLAEAIVNAMKAAGMGRGGQAPSAAPAGRAGAADLGSKIDSGMSVEYLEDYGNKLADLEKKMQTYKRQLEDATISETARQRITERLSELTGDYDTNARRLINTLSELDEVQKQKLVDQDDDIESVAQLDAEHKKLIKELEEGIRLYGEYSEQLKRSEKSQKAFYDRGVNLGIQIHSLSTSVRTFLEIMDVRGFSGKLAAANAVTKGFISSTFSLGAIFGGLASKVMDSYMALDKTRTQFQKSVGPIAQYETTITNVRRETLGLGVGTEELMQAQADLVNGLTSYKDMSARAQEQLGTFAVTMKQVGIETKTTTELQRLFINSFGMIPEQAADAQRSIVSFAHSTGQNVEQVSQSFVRAMDTLGVYGKKASGEFIKLGQIARKAGVDVNSFIDVAKRFDTISGAADAVGDLNAMLGGGFIDTMQMLNASHSERILMIRQSLEMAGKDINSMGRYEQMYLTQALGLKNVTELQSVMNKTTSELTSAIQEESMSEEKAIEIAKQNATITEKFQEILSALYPVVEQVTKIVKSFADAIAYLVSWSPEATLAIAGLIGIATTFVTKFVGKTLTNFAEGVADKFTKPLSKAVEMSTGQLETMTSQATASASKMKSASFGMLAFGAAILMVGAAVYLMGQSQQPLMDVAGAFAIIVGVMGLVMGLLTKFSVLGPAATLIMLAFGGAIFLVGAGIAAASMGLSDFLDSLSAFGKGGFEVVGVFSGMAAGVATLGLALMSVSNDDLVALAMLLGSMSNLKGAEVSSSMTALTTSMAAINDLKTDWMGMALALSVVTGGGLTTTERQVKNIQKTNIAAVSDVTSTSTETYEREVAIIEKIIDKKLSNSVLNIKLVVEGIRNELFRVVKDSMNKEVLTNSGGL